MTKRIVILGPNGMLGQNVNKYFSPDNEIILFNMRYSQNARKEFLSALQNYEPEVIINCIGKIPQKTSTFEDLFVANALLPLELNAAFDDTVIIHPSTDCVFSSDKKEPNNSFDAPNAQDEYGLSKIYGELSGVLRANTFIIRSSIIGLTDGYKSEGLLDWFMRQDESVPINGYTNHIWNGVTAFEWCGLAEQLIFDPPTEKQSGIIQIGSKTPVSKYELLTSAKDIFSKKIDIIPLETSSAVNRVLNPKVQIESVAVQLKRYWDWLGH